MQHKLSDFRRLPATEAWVFGDEHEDAILDGKFGVNPAPSNWDEWPAARHNGRGAFSFADGHVSTHKWVDPRTRFPVMRQPPSTDPPGSVDSYWIFIHATAYLNR